MSSIMRMAVMAFLLAVPLAFADIGPGPEIPDITVTLMESGQPAGGVESITFHCMGVESAEPGSVNPYPVDFPCSGGVCTNSGAWYYKFNPCFMFEEGYFSYMYNGKQIRSESFNASTPGRNNMVIDAPTGQISTGGVQPGPGGLCGLGMVALPAALLGAVAFGQARRK